MSLRSAWRSRLWLTLPALAVLYVLLVLGTTQWLAGMRIDLTRDGLYTLSPGTRDILAHLQQPLELTLYFSDRASHGLPQLRAYHQRVVGMLEEVARDSNGRVSLKQVDPLPFSEEEDRAGAAGLTSVRGDGSTGPIFFGLAGRNVQGGETASIPFFLFAKERFLEYDIAKLLYELSDVHKPRVAIYSGLPIWGGTDADGNAAPAWTVLQQLQQLFDVHRLDEKSLDTVGTDVQVLALIHPAGLPQAAVQAIDGYLQRGGHLVAFVDPDSEVDGGMPSNLPVLFHAWGVEFDPGRVLLDRSRALVVQSPVTGQPVRHPAVLGLTRDELNHRDPVTAALSVINVSTAGYFRLAPESGVRLDPLVQSTTEAMSVPVARVGGAFDPSTLYQGYQPGGEHFAIAVRLEGTLPAAFPSDGASPGVEPGGVILVADTDMLSDRLWVQPNPSSDQGLMSPFANNGDFFVNAIDDLAGPSRLIAIRGRAVTERAFTRVDALRRQADEKFKARQLQLQDELAATEQSIASLHQAASGAAATPAQKAAVARFMQRKADIRDQLRAVQRNLDADIQRLSMQLKFIDILLIPILVALAGLLYGAWRIRRRRAARTWQ